jgi:hypothetical protein
LRINASWLRGFPAERRKSREESEPERYEDAASVLNASYEAAVETEQAASHLDYRCNPLRTVTIATGSGTGVGFVGADESGLLDTGGASGPGPGLKRKRAGPVVAHRPGPPSYRTD